jgi:hypothetical protein
MEEQPTTPTADEEVFVYVSLLSLRTLTTCHPSPLTLPPSFSPSLSLLSLFFLSPPPLSLLSFSVSLSSHSNSLLLSLPYSFPLSSFLPPPPLISTYAPFSFSLLLLRPSLPSPLLSLSLPPSSLSPSLLYLSLPPLLHSFPSYLSPPLSSLSRLLLLLSLPLTYILTFSLPFLPFSLSPPSIMLSSLPLSLFLPHFYISLPVA